MQLNGHGFQNIGKQLSHLCHIFLFHGFEHCLCIGVLLDFLPTQLLINRSCGNADGQLCQYHIAIRTRMCDICHHLADSLTQNCAATDAVRDIRTQSASHFLQLCFGKPQTKQAVHAHQNSRTIRTAAGKPCRNGDSFINLNKHTLLYAEGLPH